MTWLEAAGFISGAACVWLVVRRNIWNFPVGIANTLVLWFVFMQAGLYADAWLQVVYLVLNVLGWYWWLRGGPQRTSLSVTTTPAWAWPAALAFVAVATWIIFLALTSHTDSSVPLADALTTGLSLGAQLMLSRKWIGNWWLWIAADVLYIGLYATKGLYLTSALYVIFLAMCLIGLKQWREVRATTDGLTTHDGGSSDATVSEMPRTASARVPS